MVAFSEFIMDGKAEAATYSHGCGQNSENTIFKVIVPEIVGFIFLNYKSKVADVFWKYKAFVEYQSGCKFYMIRTGNGTEYTFEKYNKFCNEAEIEHQLTTPYTL